MRSRFTALVFLAAGALLLQRTATAQSAPYRLEKVAEDVYLGVPSSPGATAANVPVIISTQDVVLVGTHLSPASARALIDQVKTLTDRPVRFIVNTHYHAPAPSAPRETFPAGVDVVGHELARRVILLDDAG